MANVNTEIFALVEQQSNSNPLPPSRKIDPYYKLQKDHAEGQFKSKKNYSLCVKY